MRIDHVHDHVSDRHWFELRLADDRLLIAASIGWKRYKGLRLFTYWGTMYTFERYKPLSRAKRLK